MITASVDGEARVWTTEPAQRVTYLVGHGDAAVYSAEFSPSGGHALTAAEHSARIWDATTGRELLKLEHPAPLTIARFSPDGKTVATGADDGVVRTWDARSGAALRTMTGHTGIIADVAWDSAGARIVSAGRDGTARVWSAETGEVVRVLDGHGGAALSGVAFQPGRDVVATIGGDNVTRLWDVATGRQLKAFEDRQQRRAVAFDRTGARVVSTTLNRSPRVWNVESGAVELELNGHLGTVRRAGWNADGTFLLTASYDGTMRIWDASQGDLLAVLPIPDAWVMCASFSPDGSRIVAGRGDGIAEIWELPELDAATPLEQVVRCRAPYDTAGDEIVPRAVVPEDCAARP
jgi:WD40 repeat protein